MSSSGVAPKRIGILGGSFDPPHLAHVALGQAAVVQLGLDGLCVVPTGQAWHKARVLTEATHRLAMTQLAFADIPQAWVDPRETRRAGPSYTIDTLRELCAEFSQAEFFLIIGADQAQALTTWQSWQEILQSATICVADRPDLTRFRAVFDAEKAYPERFFHLQMPSMAISATDIRSAISTHQNVTALVGESVARYIADHHLYLSS
ncbi:nicotinate (nicotinamide) nucleotide adenylyltransferase [Rhodoferax fermentans]|uniref:Probable nicotinate-nucleotide adenylyltransferase n=1 Tax=Rhodoferax fermentans TaxID=28066 RepID=A0A1T1AYX4_RHOFE|nr:nicotinate (nicotinamide) nucleotide adenylyltransferase [Rhodoferax fermentans]MBK1681989.1 nicotinate (nicotinamide) nucleotide adenylyltransferase [Rhodoferax fermentans]OOV09193.1 nicotinate (nicotinamide) nucleotide adenylyltransferase [Rhodoferax fermentans]